MTIRPEFRDKAARSAFAARTNLPSRSDPEHLEVVRQRDKIRILSITVGSYTQNAFGKYVTFMDRLQDTSLSQTDFTRSFRTGLEAWNNLTQVMRDDLEGREFPRAPAQRIEVDESEIP
jgi:hypothetical protein